MTRVLAILLAVVGAYRFRQSGLGVRDVKGAIRNVLQGSVASLVQVWGLARERLVV